MSFSRPRIQTYKSDGAIPKGSAVKIGTDRGHVAKCTAATDKSIGIAAGSTSGAEESVEVYLPGGGGKGLAQASISAGALLTSHTDGSLKPVAAANNRVIAMAMEDASANDIFALEVLVAQATATES
jgi:hypothetical protein